MKALSLFLRGTRSHEGLSETIKKLIYCDDLTNEVGAWLEGLFLSHESSDFLGLLVSHELEVTNTSLLPFFSSHSVELTSHLENAFLLLFTSDLGNFRKINLYFLAYEIDVRVYP